MTGAPVVQNVGPRIHPCTATARATRAPTSALGQGAPIQAAADGVVVSIENGGPYGLHTVDPARFRVSTMYAHQSGTSVSVGTRSSAVRSSGRSDPPDG